MAWWVLIAATARAASPEPWVPGELLGPADAARPPPGVVSDHGPPVRSARGLAVRGWIHPSDAARLAALGWSFTAAPPPGPPAGVRDPEAGDAVLRALADSAPRAGLVQVGVSREGREILGLWLGASPGTAPVARLVGGHHGDETTGYETPLVLAETLAGGDGVDPEITAILDRTTVWVVPYVNPDGIARNTRYDALGIDLNRDYDYAWSVDEPGAAARPFSAPETRAMRALGDRVRPVWSLSFHSGATNLGFPWNYTTDPPPDADGLAALAATWGDAADDRFDVFQGADWYTTRGDLDDWAYGRFGVFDYTVETADEKAPSADLAAIAVGAQLAPTLALLALTPDAHGTVTDAETGAPLDAWVTLGGQPGTTDPTTGAWWRFAPDGATDLVISAPGWEPVTVPVSPDADVALTPTARVAELPTPRLLAGAATVALPTAFTGTATLARPGADPVTVAAVDGALEVPALEPGLWTISLPDGTAWPHGLVVMDPGVALEVTDDTLVLADPAPGAAAWALTGPARSPAPLPELSPGVFDLTAVPADGVRDLVVWNRGLRGAINDGGAPDAAKPDLHEALTIASACDHVGGPGAAWGLAATAAAALSGRRTRRGGRAGRAAS